MVTINNTFSEDKNILTGTGSTVYKHSKYNVRFTYYIREDLLAISIDKPVVGESLDFIQSTIYKELKELLKCQNIK